RGGVADDDLAGLCGGVYSGYESHSKLGLSKPSRLGSGSVGGRPSSASAEHMLDSELVEMGKTVPVCAQPLDVELLGSRPIGEQIRVRLGLSKRWDRKLRDLARAQSLLHLRIGAEGRRSLLQEQVRAHVGRRRDPDAGRILGPERLVVEMAGPVVGRRWEE